MLPAVKAVAKPAHHAALPFADLPGFMVDLHQQQGTAPRALELLILTAARTNEVLAATWDEIDLVNRSWVIPAKRMKNGREHRVPLSAPALKLLRALPPEPANPHLFIGTKPGFGLNGMALARVLERG